MDYVGRLRSGTEPIHKQVADELKSPVDELLVAAKKEVKANETAEALFSAAQATLKHIAQLEVKERPNLIAELATRTAGELISAGLYYISSSPKGYMGYDEQTLLLGVDGHVYVSYYYDTLIRHHVVNGSHHKDEEIVELIRSCYINDTPVNERTDADNVADSNTDPNPEEDRPAITWWLRFISMFSESTRQRVKRIERANANYVPTTPEPTPVPVATVGETRTVEIYSEADIDNALDLRGGDVLRIVGKNLPRPVVINIRDSGPVFVNVIGADNHLCYSELYNHDRRIVWAPYQAAFKYVPLDTPKDAKLANRARRHYKAGGIDEGYYVPELKYGDILEIDGIDTVCYVDKIEQGAVVCVNGIRSRLVCKADNVEQGATINLTSIRSRLVCDINKIKPGVIINNTGIRSDVVSEKEDPRCQIDEFYGGNFGVGSIYRPIKERFFASEVISAPDYTVIKAATPPTEGSTILD